MTLCRLSLHADTAPEVLCAHNKVCVVMTPCLYWMHRLKAQHGVTQIFTLSPGKRSFSRQANGFTPTPPQAGCKRRHAPSDQHSQACSSDWQQFHCWALSYLFWKTRTSQILPQQQIPTVGQGAPGHPPCLCNRHTERQSSERSEEGVFCQALGKGRFDLRATAPQESRRCPAMRGTSSVRSRTPGRRRLPGWKRSARLTPGGEIRRSGSRQSSLAVGETMPPPSCLGP